MVPVRCDARSPRAMLNSLRRCRFVALVSFCGLFAAAAAAAPAQCPTPWSALGAGVDSAVRAFARLPNGDLVAGGTFTTAGSTPAARIARWDGSAWWPLGAGVTGSSGPPTVTTVECMLVLPNGDLVVGGNFNTAGGVPANAIARWNGATWSTMGSTAMGIVRALALLPNGDLVAGGSWVMGGSNPQHLARWDGASWHPLGIGVTTFEVRTLATLPGGDLVAGGSFTNLSGGPGNYIARWNGATWSAMGSGMANGIFGTWVQSLCVLPDGDLVAGGNFTTAGGVPANRVARWNGANWSAFGGGIDLAGLTTQVQVVATMADGDLVVGGQFASASGVAANCLARWRAGAWTGMGAGMNQSVTALLGLADGDLLAGGMFTTADGVAANHVARRTPTCAAAAAALGAACAGATTPVALATQRLPWLGGVFEARASGLAPGSLAVGVFGLATRATPLSSLHPLGAAGCTLWVDDDVVLQFAVGNGSVGTAIAIPAAAALAGGVFHHQVVPIELDAAGDLRALTSSNALTLTIGSL